MTPKQQFYETQAKTVIKNLEKRGMEGHYFTNSKDCVDKILSMMPSGSSISWGGTTTADETGMMNALQSGDYILLDRKAAKTPDEQRELYSKIVMTDYYFMSSNAITLDGELVNIDGIGNRTACLMHGPSNVMILAGMNKLVKDVSAAIDRVHNFAAPPNAVRLNRQTPCNATGTCNNCLSPDCLCSHTVITRHASPVGRIKVFLIGEELGF